MGKRLDTLSMNSFVATINNIMVRYGYEFIHEYYTYPNVEKKYRMENKDYLIEVDTFLHFDGETDLMIFKAPIIDGKADMNNVNNINHYDLNTDGVQKVLNSLIDNI